MFQLYDGTRRRICLVAFLLFCLLPTTLVLAWGLVRRTSWHAATEADRLSSLCGLNVSFSGIRYVRPGQAVYEGVVLADPETGGKVLQCPQLEASWTLSPSGKASSRPTLTVTAWQAEVFLDPLVGQVERLVERLLIRRPDTEAAVQITAREVLLRTRDGSQPLADVQGKTEFESGMSMAEFRFRWGVNQGNPMLVRVLRNRQAVPPATGFEFDTADAALPCSVLAVAFPGVEKAGPRSQFRGYCWANDTSDGWAGEVKNGQLTDVDLESFLGDRFSHRLSGLAQINLTSARFRHGRIEELNGEITAGPGMASQSLIQAAVERLGMTAAPPQGATPASQRYERLSSLFYLDSRGLWLRGRCDTASGQAILMDRGNLLLGEPATQPQPIGAVVQALVSPGGIQVPATRQAAWLIRRLPLPEPADRQKPPLSTASAGAARN